MKSKRKKRASDAQRARNKAWKQLSAEIRAEVGACELCGATEHLCVHHILEKKIHPELWLERNDLICVCNRCHFMIHRHRAFEFHAWLARNKPAQFKWLSEWLDKKRKDTNYIPTVISFNPATPK